MKLLSTLILTAGLTSGCATQPVRPISDANKAEVRKILTADFKFPTNREEQTYRLLREARRLLAPEEKIMEIDFKDATHAVIWISEPGLSIHGGPQINAVWDRNEWKFGDKWWLL